MSAGAKPLTKSESKSHQKSLDQSPELSSSPQIRLEIITDIPLQIGTGVSLEWTQGLLVSTSVGWLPQSYVKGINSIITAFDVYEPETAELIETTIQNSLVWRTHVGWRPWTDSGFYTRIGYTLITLGGGATTKALIEGITGTDIEDSNMMDSAQNPLYIDASSSLHLLSIGVGWDWTVYQFSQRNHLFLRTALEWSYTFTSTAVLESQSQSSRPIIQNSLDRLEKAGERYLLDTFNSYIHPPSLTLAVGYTW